MSDFIDILPQLLPINFEQVLNYIKKYQELRNQLTVIDMTPIEIMNAVHDPKGECWDVTKKIINGDAIVQSQLNHLELIIDLINEIDNLIPEDSSIKKGLNNLRDHLQEYRDCEYIKRLMLWTESLKTEIKLNEAHCEYENILGLIEGYFNVIDGGIEIMNIEVMVLQYMMEHKNDPEQEAIRIYNDL